MPHPTPSARSVKEARKSLCSCSEDGEGRFADEDNPEMRHHDSCLLYEKFVKENGTVESVALALDQRERETRKADKEILQNAEAKYLPADAVHVALNKFDALLSEAERRGMKVDERKV